MVHIKRKCLKQFHKSNLVKMLDKDAEDFFYFNKIIYIICGVWLPGNDIPLLRRFLYFTYVLGYYTTYVIFLTCEFLIFGDMLTDINKFVSYIGLLFTHLVGCFKWFILVFHRKRLETIKEALQDPEYRYTSVSNFHPRLLLSEGKIISNITTVWVFVLYTFVGVSAHISSQIKINRTSKDPYLEANTTCLDFMPYYFYIPLNITTKHQCGYVFTFMNVSLACHAWLIACLDGIFIALLNCLKTQMTILGGAFKTIRQRCLKDLNMSQNFSILHDEENPVLEKKLYEELSRCTKHLNLLLRTRDDIERSFSYVTLAQSLASLFILATCLYISSKVQIGSPEFFSQLEYFSCILTQLSLICWFGNEITSAGEQITIHLYECEWFSASARFKRSMILTMCRMQRAVYLSIGKFTPLTLATLVAVCRGSFSYFALLNNIQ